MSDQVLVADSGAVRTIRLNRPEKKNALTQPMYEVMTRSLREAAASDAIRAIVFAGAPGAFCAGADIAEFLEPAQSGGLRPKTVEFLHTLARNPKPLVAAVGGLAVGIGTTMLLHCDYVVAAATRPSPRRSRGSASSPKRDLACSRRMRMGHARAFALLAMGRPLTAAAAKEAGIVNEVVDPANVDEVALKAAQDIAALPPRRNRGIAAAAARRARRCGGADRNGSSRISGAPAIRRGARRVRGLSVAQK